MPNLRLTQATANVAMDAVTALINTGGAGSIEYYTATQPGSADSAITGQTLLVTLTWSVDAFQDAVDGTAAANAVASGAAVATGDVAWARIRDGNGVKKFDCDVGVTGATITVSSVSITALDTVQMSLAQLTHPKNA